MVCRNTTLHDTSGPPSKSGKAKRKQSDGGLLSAAAQARSLVGVNDQRLPPWCIKEPHFTPESFTLLQASIKRITKTKSETAVTTFTKFYDSFFNRCVPELMVFQCVAVGLRALFFLFLAYLGLVYAAGRKKQTKKNTEHERV